MDIVDKLKAGTQANNGKVDHPDKIEIDPLRPGREVSVFQEA